MKRIFDSVLWAFGSLWGAIMFTGLVFLLLGFVCTLADPQRSTLHLIADKFTEGGVMIVGLCLVGGISYLLGRLFRLRIDPLWTTYTLTIGGLVIAVDLLAIMGIAIAGVDMVTSDWGAYMLLVGLLGVFICLVVTFFLKGAIVDPATPEPIKREKVRRLEVIDGGRRFTPREPLFGVDPRKTHDPNEERPN